MIPLLLSPGPICTHVTSPVTRFLELAWKVRDSSHERIFAPAGLLAGITYPFFHGPLRRGTSDFVFTHKFLETLLHPPTPALALILSSSSRFPAAVAVLSRPAACFTARPRFYRPRYLPLRMVRWRLFFFFRGGDFFLASRRVHLLRPDHEMFRIMNAEMEGRQFFSSLCLPLSIPGPFSSRSLTLSTPLVHPPHTSAFFHPPSPSYYFLFLPLPLLPPPRLSAPRSTRCPPPNPTPPFHPSYSVTHPFLSFSPPHPSSALLPSLFTTEPKLLASDGVALIRFPRSAMIFFKHIHSIETKISFFSPQKKIPSFQGLPKTLNKIS